MARKRTQNTKVSGAGNSPLFVVAGLPPATDHLSDHIIRETYKSKCDVIRSTSGAQDYSVYSPNYVSQILNTLTDFILKRRDPKENFLNPSRIFFLYVPVKGFEQLLSKLDFSVFPIALASLAEWDDSGKLRRSTTDAVTQALRTAVKSCEQNHQHFDRIKLLRSTDPILLPPKNFHVNKTVRMGDYFYEMRTGVRPWSDRFSELAPIECTSEQIPKLKEKRGRFFKDHREIFFYQPHESAFHGNAWEDDEQSDEESRLIQLRSLYRFGVALPQGFQHDAQYESGKLMKNVDFSCSRNGDISVSDDHADVYPNDFVRHRTKK